MVARAGRFDSDMTATTPPAPPAPCLICSLEEADEDSRVFADELFAAESVPGYDAPGWYFLRVRRHAELITSLTTEELAAFGQRARDLVAAIETVTAVPAVYLMTFGETYKHFHALVCARGDDVPKAQRGGRIVGRLPEACDREASLALVPMVRQAYEAIAPAREGLAL
jgi:diadenosine tetraphosphate (Ap4A) HIT family hydrolase